MKERSTKRGTYPLEYQNKKASFLLKEYLYKAGFDYEEEKVEVSVMEEVSVEQAALSK